MTTAGAAFADVAVVIPMFNEAVVIGDVVARVRERFPVVVCVDDGSADNSVGIARAAGGTTLRHPINLGQGAALRTGIEYARNLDAVNWIVTFDADGQHDVEDAARMVDKAKEGDLDVVLGTRFAIERSEVPAMRRVVLKMAVAFTRLTTGLDVSDAHNGLRVVSRRAAEKMSFHQRGMAHASEILGLIATHNFRYAEEPVTIRYSEYSLGKGQSNLNVVNILHELALGRLRAAR